MILLSQPTLAVRVCCIFSLSIFWSSRICSSSCNFLSSCVLDLCSCSSISLESSSSILKPSNSPISPAKNKNKIEPRHDKTNKMSAPSEDSDQPGHPPSLIRVHEKSLGPEQPIQRTTKSLIRLGACPGWSESSLGAKSFCWFCHEVAQLFVMN